MDQPFPRLACFPDDIITLARPDIHGVGQKTRGRRDRLTVASDDFEGTAVNVHRMDESVVRSDEPNLERLTDRHRNGFGSRICLPVSNGNRFETQKQPDPYIAMLGGEFLSHGSQQEAQAKVVDPNFPGFEGLREGFNVREEWYSLKNFSQDIHVLLVLETKGMRGSEYQRPPFPIAWARNEKKGRVYFNAMGHRDEVWTSDPFRQMLAGAVVWAVGVENVAPAANMSAVTPDASVMPPEN
jgi:type 1 glutamine amidotransferase